MVGQATPVTRAKTSIALMLAPVAPLLFAFVGSLWVVLGWAAGASPFWPDPALTLSEAAATGNAGEVVRLITIEDHDPNRAWPVRDGILGPPKTVTPLEAAVTLQRSDLFDVLLRHGAVVPASGAARAALICRAANANVPEIVERLLQMGDRSDPRDGCVPPPD